MLDMYGPDLRYLRSCTGLTQAALAAEAGVPLGYLAYLEGLTWAQYEAERAPGYYSEPWLVGRETQHWLDLVNWFYARYPDGEPPVLTTAQLKALIAGHRLTERRFRYLADISQTEIRSMKAGRDHISPTQLYALASALGRDAFLALGVDPRWLPPPPPPPDRSSPLGDLGPSWRLG